MLKYIIGKYRVWDFGGGAGEKTSSFLHEVASKFIRFGLVYILNLSPFLKGWETTFPDSLRLYSKCRGYMQLFAESMCKMLRLYAAK